MEVCMFKFFLNMKKKTSFFLIFFFFIIYNGFQIYAYPLNDSDSERVKNSQLSTLNPCDYEIDYSRKHNSQFWRHENGHAFADNARVFYDIPGIKMVPCRTYQEYANKSQIASNATGTLCNFYPPAKFV
jgi:hypothetical protein